MAQHPSNATSATAASNPAPPRYWGLRIGISFIAFAVLFFHLWLRSGSDEMKKGLDATAFGLVVVALLPWLALFVESFELLGVKFAAVKQQVEKQGQELAALRFLLQNYLMYWEHVHLQKIAGEMDDAVNVGQSHPWFAEELRRIGKLKLIKSRSDGLEQKMQELFNTSDRKEKLRDHFEITDLGKEFLVHLNTISAKVAAEKAGAKG